MIHPSYTELIEAINANSEDDDTTMSLNSRYSLVLAASKRARQIIAGSEPLVEGAAGKKPLSVAIDELYKGKVKILAPEENEEEETAAQTEEVQAANLYSVFSLICALSLFVFFKQMQIGYKPWINKFAAAMFGVYLIHENPIVYPWLWSKVFHVPEYLGSSWFILYALAVITIVFFICAILDLIWEKVLQSGYQKYLFPRLQPLDKRVTDFLNAPANQK